jgi:predicted amidohydrolase
MKICAVQFRPIPGDLKNNISAHAWHIGQACAAGAQFVFFPELSITGYEPSLADALAFERDDHRLDIFQQLSNEKNLIIAVGVPLRNAEGVSISLLFFQPGQTREVYSKKYLHEDELPFFNSPAGTIEILDGTIAPAICYELSIADHAAQAAKLGASTYLVSVAKTESGMSKALQQLSATATKHQMNVILANCIGPCDNFLAAGRSCALDDKGRLLAELNSDEEGYVILDTMSNETTIRQVRVN